MLDPYAGPLDPWWTPAWIPTTLVLPGPQRRWRPPANALAAAMLFARFPVSKVGLCFPSGGNAGKLGIALITTAYISNERSTLRKARRVFGWCPFARRSWTVCWPRSIRRLVGTARARTSRLSPKI